MSKGVRIVKLGLLAVMVVALALPMSGCGRQEKGTISVSGKAESDYPELAKISMVDVITVAQEKFPGKVLSVGLQDEKGYLIYEVEIVGTDKAINEVKVDAGNGAVLSMERKKTGNQPVLKEAVSEKAAHDTVHKETAQDTAKHQ